MEELIKYSSFEDLKGSGQNKETKPEDKKEFEDFIKILQKSKKEMKRKKDKRKR